MSESKRQAPIDVVAGLPESSPEDVDALQAARGTSLTLAQIEQLHAALPKPTYEDLARRPILDGTPFKL